MPDRSPYEHKRRDDQIGDEIYDSLFFFDRMGIASSTEMTGLIPTPPENASERAAYNELRDLPLPETDTAIKTRGRMRPL